MHWTCVLRMPTGWLHYDGMDQPKFTFYNLEDATAAQRERRVSVAMFEVVDQSETRNFLNENHDWRDTFVGISADIGFTGFVNFPGTTNEHVEDDHESIAVATSPEDLFESINSSIKAPPNMGTKRKSSAKKPKKGDSRVVMGWSMPKRIPQYGPKPKCKTCGKIIERNEERVRLRFQSETRPEIKPVHQFHLSAHCLNKLETKHKQSFLEKKWPQKKLQIVQKTLAGIADDDSDSDQHKMKMSYVCVLCVSLACWLEVPGWKNGEAISTAMPQQHD